MSSIEAKKVQTDELLNVAGNDLPTNIKPLTPFCYGLIKSQVLLESVNVSSITVRTNGIMVNMIKSASSANYSLIAQRDGSAENKVHSIAYFWSEREASVGKRVASFTLIPKVDGKVETAAGEIGFVVYDNGNN